MLKNLPIEKVLFLDIETVPMSPDFEQLPDIFKPLWDKKSRHFRKEEQTAEEVYERAGIYAEFGKVICICFGTIFQRDGQWHTRIRHFASDDEKEILVQFAELLEKLGTQGGWRLCAHNGKEFDFPYISRRMLVNDVKLPALLDVTMMKPWETSFLDTMELWKFGDYKNYTSLELLAALFGIPSPKNDIDGSQVAKVYYEDKDLERIVKYCKNDVLTIIQLFLKYRGEPLIENERIDVGVSE